MSGVLLVTGGSRGIGAAVAALGARSGFDIVLSYRSDERAAHAVVDAVRTAGARAIAVAADVGREDDIVNLFAAVDAFGPLNVLVNNAGITGGFSRVVDVRGDVLERVFAVNVSGAILCAREAVRRLSTARGGSGGSIVNVSSLAARLGGANDWVHYAASKGAIETFTIGLAREVANEGVRVNAVSAGIVDTELHAAAGDPQRAARLAPSIPLGRVAAPAEIAEAIVWLASPAASYVTGAILDVGGGR